MLRIVNCGWYANDNPRKEYLRYVLENIDSVDVEEKIEAIRYLFNDYFNIIHDEGYQKVFLYGHGEMIEVKDEILKEWIEDALTDWTSLFDVIK